MWAQKLIAYDHLEGDPGLDGGRNGPQFTEILNMICNCVDNSSSDRYVILPIGNSLPRMFLILLVYSYLTMCSTILQVLKVLLTAVSSTKFRGTLLVVERVSVFCCNFLLNWVCYVLSMCRLYASSLVPLSMMHLEMWHKKFRAQMVFL